MVELTAATDMAMNIVTLVVSVVSVGAVGGLITYFLKQYLRYKEYTCIIWEHDKFGQLKESKDAAGIYVDRKTKDKRFFLKKGKVGLNPDHVITMPSIGNKKVCYLLKNGSKNYRFIRPTFDISNKRLTNHVGEEDTNWALYDYNAHTQLLQNDLLTKLLPFIGLAILAVVFIAFVMIILKRMEVFNELAVHFEAISDNMVMLKQNTTVITG